MKKTVQIFTIALSVALSGNLFSQNVISTMEEVVLATDTFDDGAGGSTGFTSGNAFFPTVYNTSWFFWESGWALSDMTDSVTSGYGNLYSAKTAKGYNSSNNYAIGAQNSVLRLTGMSLGDSVQGFYVTNTTYAYNSMRDGDAFAKKFGGPSGNDPDWFRLTVKKYYQGILSTDSVYFYLADFRFTNNANDYILNSWQYVNCHALGMADSLLFTLSSSDTGSFGMNTPAFYAIDNFTTRASITGIASAAIKTGVAVFPNPAKGNLCISLSDFILNEQTVISVYDVAGRKISATQQGAAPLMSVDVSALSPGNYFVQIVSGNISKTIKFIKE
jgi:hypothetical protein